MNSSRWHRRHICASALVLCGVACTDRITPVDRASPPDSPTQVPLAALLVSDARPIALAVGGSISSQATGAELAYISLPTGSLPDAISVTISNRTRSGSPTPPIPFINGGFDPVAVVAKADDELALRVTGVTGAISEYRAIVPKRRPPRVLRTDPPKGTTDVALNSRIWVVFTEPVDMATVTPATVQVLQGSRNIAGSLRSVSDNVVVEFVPDEALGAGVTYSLVVTKGVLDADGDALEAEVAADFTTQARNVNASASVAPAASIAAGGWHTCALRIDGTALCWGGNWWGQVGAGSSSPADVCPSGGGGSYPCAYGPTLVVGGRGFASLASGSEHECALTASGEAFCWGADHNGHANGIPFQVGGSLTFESLAAGYYHTCGLRTGGRAYCWGHELLGGALGTGGAGVTSSPAAVLGNIAFTTLTSGAHHVCGLDARGVAYCWGMNMYNQLGSYGGEDCNGPRTSSATFVWLCVKTPTPVSGGIAFVSLSAGWQHTCGLTSSGRAYCWGAYDSPGYFSAEPRPVDGNLVFASLSRGELAGHACGVTAGSAVYCWGRNESGQLGDGSTVSTFVPTRVLGAVAFVSVTTGDEHSCGITPAREVYCWGGNTWGQLGIGRPSVGSLVPIRVAGQ